jgi:hypothetical protein
VALADRAPRTRSILGTALQVLVLVLLLAIVALVLAGVFAVVSLVSAPRDVASGVTNRAGQVISDAQQAIQDATDPNHPPAGLSYDTELTGVDVWHLGEGLPGGTEYLLTVQSIQRRTGAASPDSSLYAVLHAELRQPRLTRILGQVVRSDSDPHDYALYKGETFRVSRVVYRVNWISQEAGELAAGVVRNPDTITQTLKFDYP